jgi:hypothetical protein
MRPILNRFFGLAIGLPIVALVISGFNSYISRSVQADKGSSAVRQAETTAMPTLSWDQWLADYCKLNPGTDGCPTAEPTMAIASTPISRLYDWRGLQIDEKQYINRDELGAILSSYPDFPSDHLEDWVNIIMGESAGGDTQARGDDGHAWGLGQINDNYWGPLDFPGGLWELRLTAKGNLDMVNNITNRYLEHGPWHYVWPWHYATKVLGFGSFLP